ncbi:MAG TPA: hypothetical protein VGO40_14955 [Longimicrobium sp.]|jgi:hypothetical protein|nr:hypothetical protein [Longimicrobium sp.]
MDAPLSPDFRLSDTDGTRDGQLASSGESCQAALLLARTPPEEWDAADGVEDAESPGPLSLAREAVRIGWEETANPGPPPADAEDQDAADAYARSFALARFARRVVEGDPHAWIEALASYWGKVPLPFDVPCSVAVEDDLSIRIGLDLPSPSAPGARASRSERDARYVETCCRVVLTLAADVFRVLPAADSLYVTAARAEADPATGHPRRAILLRLATDRASLAAINLAAVTPSASFEHLGGALRRERGELVPLAFEGA